MDIELRLRIEAVHSNRANHYNGELLEELICSTKTVGLAGYVPTLRLDKQGDRKSDGAVTLKSEPEAVKTWQYALPFWLESARNV